MNTDKVTEMEVKKLTPVEIQNVKGAEKGKMGETKVFNLFLEEEKGLKDLPVKMKNSVASTPKHTAESELKNPPEEICTIASLPASTPKQTEDVYRRVRLYKRISAVFIILSLLLLAVVLALAMKLNMCPESAESKCTCELCQTMYPSLKSIPGCQCCECEEDWEKFENSCYFFSETWLNWQESREECQKQGGDLVVIDNEHVQEFLNEYGNVRYWIGLHYSEEQRWMWINNTASTQSYWSHGPPNPGSQSSCALLNGGGSDLNNWSSDKCTVYSQYICQRC
ncbi:natural killer cells antigen CD94-like isoform X2 [Hemibagrus wyckioides]|uniref:natural killer cells antigen CD94-like isoform X2 n=1 Tax=Hemibagrus wyckioides TaxID=337641 RepID=UPI00266BD9FB|nr:natural killer cells antigen CD94-like isoform X2 [Hemibagrus wyckioides]